MNPRRNHSMLHALARPILLLLVLCIIAQTVGAREYWVFFGTRAQGPGKGFSVARFNAETGELSRPEVILEATAPAYFVVHPDGRHLYSINSVAPPQGPAEGSVSAYALDRAAGKLSFINQQPTGGATPSYVSLDNTGRYLFAANYTGGSICVYAIKPDGSLGARTAFVQHTGSSVNPQRQTHPYAHSIVIDRQNKFVLVGDLGLDKVLIYRFNQQDGTLIPNDPAYASVAPGSGPRHVKFHPRQQFAYVVNEISNSISVFGWNSARGTLTERQTLSTLPADFKGVSTAAEIQVHPNGKFVYASNRGADNIAVFAVDQRSGKLTLVQHVATQGKMPRNFTFDPTGRWIIVTNHDSDNAVVFAVDAKSGKLTQHGQPVTVPNPYCERFVAIAK